MKEMFSETGHGLSNVQIQRIEQSRGVIFPEDFKEYLREVNGGWLIESSDFIFGEGHVTAVRMLFGFDEDPDWNIDRIQEGADYIPNCLLPIGDDGASLFILDLRVEMRGRVYIRSVNALPNEINPIIDPKIFYNDPDQAALYHHVADNFTRFVDLIVGK